MPSYNGNTSFVFDGVAPGLPTRDMTVAITRPHVRGSADITMLPSAENGYTTEITIRDPQVGADRYTIDLTFTPK
jgi:hypothetical protein